MSLAAVLPRTGDERLEMTTTAALSHVHRFEPASAAVMLLRPDVLAGAVMLRAMVPLAGAPAADLAGKAVLIVSGAADPIVPADNAARLAAMLQAAGADVRHEIVPAGHGLSQPDVTLTRAWIDGRQI
jgi:phospholipase/carboxylesterase